VAAERVSVVDHLGTNRNDRTERPSVLLEDAALDEELDRFKRINLPEYAASRGYRLIGREPTRSGGWRCSTRTSLLMRHPITDDKIVIRVEGDGHWTYFSVRDARDNGTIIDFLQRRGALTLGKVREELGSWAGQERPTIPREHFRPSLGVQRRDRTAVRDAFARAQIASNSVYLNSRGIRPETLCSERFRGTWRVDDRDNLLFPHRDGPGIDGVCGFEKKSRGFIGFATGGTKTLWVSNVCVGDTKLVFAEAVIDVFSYHQLHRDDHACYASTGGSFGEPQARFIARAIAKMGPGATIVIATDNDDAGEKLAAKIADLAGRATVVRDRSRVGKDWNDCLQERERDYIESLRSRNRGPER
jgi:hypothetical protein